MLARRLASGKRHLASRQVATMQELRGPKFGPGKSDMVAGRRLMT
jgi:hypothetical protein